MNYDRAIYETLATVAALGTRIYPSAFPQPSDDAAPVWPAARYVLVSGVPNTDIEGAGLGDVDDCRYQIDLVAESYADASALRLAVFAAMESVLVTSPEQPCPAIRQGDSRTYDVLTRTHRVVIDYILQPSDDQ